MPSSVRSFMDVDGSVLHGWHVDVTPLVLLLRQDRVSFIGRIPSAEWLKTELATYDQGPEEMIVQRSKVVIGSVESGGA